MNSSSFEADFEVASRIAHVQPVKGLREKIDPRHTALVVIDMQNDFIADQGLIAREGRDVSQAKEMAEHLPKLIKTARAAGVFVVFVRNVYTSEQNFYLSDVWLEQAARKRAGGYTRIPVCAAGSWGGDFYGDVRPEPNDPIVTKHRYSAFYNTDLDTILRANTPQPPQRCSGSGSSRTISEATHPEQRLLMSMGASWIGWEAFQAKKDRTFAK
jgi:isochorismate hydrolase